MPDTASVDYRALIRDRKAKDSRPVIRYPMCLVPELFADLAELLDTKRANDDDDEDGPVADVRMGAPVASLDKLIREAEDAITAASVVAVFKAPTAAQQDALNQAFEDDTPAWERSRDMCLQGFVRFERNREPIDADQLGKDDLADLLTTMSQGELLDLGNKIITASGGAPDLPFSARRSLLSRPSAATSKRR